MPTLELDLTIRPTTGLSVGGSGSTGVRADKTMQRDSRNRPLIPASQVKGRLRHACEAIVRGAGVTVCDAPNPATTCPHAEMLLGRFCPICELFGSPWRPGRLRFRDLPLRDGPDDGAIRSGVGVDRRRGTIKEHLLVFTETTRPGAGVTTFRAEKAITGTVETREQVLLLLAGLESIQSWGGGKSRGMGWADVAYAARVDEQDLRLDQRKEDLVQWLRRHIA